MKLVSMIQIAVVVYGVSSMPISSFARGDDQRCPNCEATIVLDAASVQLFSNAVLKISSIPLHIVILDEGIAGGNAQILVATYPEYADQNTLNSMDVAKKVLGFANDVQYGIRSITASWISPMDQDNHAEKTYEAIQSNVGTMGH